MIHEKEAVILARGKDESMRGIARTLDLSVGAVYIATSKSVMDGVRA